jgi:hypothetical protein
MTTDEAIQTVIIEKLKGLIIENDMVATRALLNSVRYEKNESFNQLSYDIIALDYIVGLNDGIEPGETPYPTIENIQKWINAKGLDLNAYAVRNSIITNGTTWFRLGGSDIVTESINAEKFNEVIRLSMPDIKNKITNTWQLLFKNNR